MDAARRTLQSLRIHSLRRVVAYTAACTAFMVIVPVSIVAAALAPIPTMPNSVFVGALILAGAIPLAVTPPIAFVVLYVLRLVALTIERLNDHVQVDPLTGLLVRAAFLDAVCRRLDREGGVLLLVDADHFKHINDTHGHDVGDQALRAIAGAMQGACGTGAFIGRLGGEEFGVAIPGSTVEDGKRLANAVLRAIEARPCFVGDCNVNMTASAGGAVHVAGTPIERTFKTADRRLYDAKRQGRNRAVFEDRAAIVETDARGMQMALQQAVRVG